MNKYSSVLSSLLLFFSFNAVAVELQNGGVVSGSISAPAQEDTFTFDGSTGNRVSITMFDSTSGSLIPDITVYDPNGNYITTTWNALTASIENLALPLNGTYSVLAKDRDDVNTGAYDIHFILAPGAQEHGPLTNGGSLLETITIGDLDSYTFYAETGNRVSIVMADLAGDDPNVPGDLVPELYVYNPNGAYVTTTWNARSASIENLNIPLTGTYTVIAKDRDDIRAGPYEIFFIRAPGAAEHGSLVNGGVVSEQLTLGDLDSYVFNAETGDRVSMTMVDLDGDDPNLPGDLIPELYIYDPNGNYVTTNWNARTVSIENLSIPLSGAYTVVAKDRDDQRAGPYEIHFARAPGAQEHKGLINGGKHDEHLTQGDIDSYTFYGETGERVSLTFVDLAGDDPNTPGNFIPRLYVYDPNGGYLTTNWNARSASIENLQLPLNGTYTVIVKDRDDQSFGPYELHFVQAPGAAEHGMLSNGASVNEDLTLGDLDSYTFYGQTGDAISLTMEDLNGGDLVPELYLYDPNGNYVTTNWAAQTAGINAQLSLNGAYTVLAKDRDDLRYGPYSLAFTSSNNSVPSASTVTAPGSSDHARQPVVSWTPSGYATWYYVWVQDLAGNILLRRWYTAENANCAAASNQRCSVVLPLTIDTAVRWWVRTWNSVGSGPWSNSLDFSTIVGAPPASNPVSPIGAATSATPVYTWDRITNASWYYLWVDDSTGARIRKWVTAGQAGCVDDGQQCTHRSNTSVSGAASWWVRSWNSDQFGAWSSRADFEF